MASETDSKGRSYMMVGKGQTSLLIPKLLPSDSTDNAVSTLFREENELGPTNKSDNLSTSEIQTTTPVSCNSKNQKRKLEIEFVLQSETTPRRKSEKFSHLQNFWENKSGRQSAIKLHVKEGKTKPKAEFLDNIGSPIDRALKNFSLRSPSTPAKSASEIASRYTQLIHKVIQTKTSQGNDNIGSSVFDFNEDDTKVERVSLMKFRQSQSASPSKPAAKMEVESSLTFNPSEFYLKKEIKLTSDSEMEDSFIMPPPDSLPKCLSNKKSKTSSPKNTPKRTSAAAKLPEDCEFSPDDLTSPSPETGAKRKHSSKKRLMSMEPCHYSQLYTPSDGDSCSENKFEKSSRVLVTVNMNNEIHVDNITFADTDSEVWTKSKSEISLSNISAITPLKERRESDIHDELKSCEKSSDTKQMDSFFDIVENTNVAESQNEINIDDVSAIESENNSTRSNKLSFDCSEFHSPEVVKVAGGKKKLILENAHTTLNETLISVGDISCNDTSIQSDVADAVRVVVKNLIGLDNSSSAIYANTKKDEISEDNKDQGLERCEDSRMSEAFPEFCNHAVSFDGLANIVDNSTHLEDIDHSVSDDITTPETSEEHIENDSGIDNSMSTDYDSILISPPPLQIDITRLGDESVQSSNTAVEVTENIKYEPSTDIVNLDSHQQYDHTELETLKTLSVNKEVSCRSSMYDNVLEENASNQSSFLSVPFYVDVTKSVQETAPDHTVTVDHSCEREYSTSKIGLMDPCYSPDLSCSESLSSSPVSSRNMCWSPDLHSDTIYTTDTSESDTEFEYPHIMTKRRSMKRRLNFDNDDEKLILPSPKLPKTPLTDKQFEFPDICEMDNAVSKDVDERNDNDSCLKSEIECETKMMSLSDIYEESFLSDTDYPESLNSSSAYCDSFTFWSPASSVSTDRQWSPLSSEFEHDDEDTSAVSSKLETFPVYTQEGPSHLNQPRIIENSPKVSTQPLDLSMTFAKKNFEHESGTVTSESESVENGNENSKHKLNQYEPICISEPSVATLQHNHSTVWKEINIGGFFYSYTPSDESLQYATDCYNNSVYGGPDNSDSDFFYTATPLFPNMSNGVPKSYETENQSEIFRTCANLPKIPGITVPLQDKLSVAQEGLGVTPINVTSFAQNYENIEQIILPSISGNQIENEIGKSSNGRRDACYYGDKHSSSCGYTIKCPMDGYESSGNSAANSSDSDHDNDLIKMMDDNVRDKLKKKAGSRFISPDTEKYELIDSLKLVKPYVISGWISSTYLMALANKTDVVNDMFEDALDKKGEIHDWIIENCRKTTPAVLARDLLFRLFTLEELKDLNLTSLGRKQKFKAIRKCVEKYFPQKFTRRVWSKCLALIKSSVSTLFKHRVKQVQNFFTMNGTLN